MMADLLASVARMVSGAKGRWVGGICDLRPRIYYGNHSSHLDALVIWAVLPPALRKRTRPVAARDYWIAGALRRYLAEKVFHAILIERAKPTVHDNPITQILSAMGAENSIIIFPEGGRMTGPDPAPFKSGLYHLAKKRPDLELVPVLIDNLNRILPKGEILPVPMLGSVTFGRPLKLETGEDRDAFLARARNAIIALRQS